MPANASDAPRGTAPEVKDLIGASAEVALGRFGRAMADRVAGEDRWLRWEGPDWSLRLRARPDEDGSTARIRSWTVSFARGFDTVEDAMRAIGVSPPASRTGPGPGPLRLPLRDGAGGLHSLTAALRGGRVHAVSGFDEPPDWSNSEGGG